ncbi:Succinate-semialdehyde dehydrogenase [NAD] [Methanosarcina sp. WH1]|nr:Succinate-semialdehyde dehydrogenase [NAD] [Methanosarcina sp. WH1]
MNIKLANPYTEEVNWTYEVLSFGDCEGQIEKSRAAFSGWGVFSVEERTTYIARVVEVLRQNKRVYAEIITKEMGKPMKIGDPVDEGTDIRPVVKKESVDSLEKTLKDAKKKGVEPYVYGEGREKGFFFRPALIPAASTDMKACSVEVFGPIAPVIMVKDDEAVEIANSTEFGFGADVWSADLERAGRLAKRIRSGFVTINGGVRSKVAFWRDQELRNRKGAFVLRA